MNHQDKVPGDLLISRGLDEWAKRSGVDVDRSLVANLTSLYAAATRIIEAIDHLAGTPDLPQREQARALLQIQTWMFNELQNHAESLREPVESAICKLYELIPDDELQ
jgi:hypothetical protein